MVFPIQRPRRLRQSAAFRRLVAETRVTPSNLIQPYFVVPGTGIVDPIAALPGVARYSVDQLVEQAQRTAAVGVPAVLLFGLPERKDAQGSEAWSPTGAVQRACTALREVMPELLIMTDICLCAYTAHGHCGVLASDVAASPRGADQARGAQHIDNDATLPLLAKIALSHAAAGAHIVAPSDMMDGRVAALRTALDAAGRIDTAIMSYAVKYASAFYGPFREAQHSAPQSGDRKSYQMDPANAREALRELQQDEAEGADLLIIKPALPCLDILHAARAATTLPLAAYQVSGEYAMLKAAAANGQLDERAAFHESLLAIRRAGADLIISYAATTLAKTL